MDVRITPSRLSGEVKIPASKSISHRLLICAGLSDGASEIDGLSMSEDIKATISCLEALGAKIRLENGKAYVNGVSAPEKEAILDCRESGSTLRFLIPVAAALGVNTTFIGAGKLPERPITPYLSELPKAGICFNYENTMPFSISGKLDSGEFSVAGDISSQFISGLLFALPMCGGDSVIKLTSALESKPYIDLTINALAQFGIKAAETENGYFIPGNQKYLPHDTKAEGDYSQAAFFAVANAIGSGVEIKNLPEISAQGDKKILEIISEMKYTDKKGLSCFTADVSDIPDLVPILAVLGAMGDKPSYIVNAKRLRIKESDRLHAVSEMLRGLGGKAEELEDGLIIHPVRLTGGEIDSFNDHRIVMAAAIASTVCKNPVIIKNAGAVRKSYPDFFRDFKNLGGTADVINME